MIVTTWLEKSMRALSLSALLLSVAPAESMAMTAFIDGFVTATGSYHPHLAPPISGGDTVFFNEPLTSDVRSDFVLATSFGSSADVQATVGDGWTRFAGTAVSVTGPAPGNDSAGAQAFFEMRVNVRDTIVLHNPALTGTIGFADLGFLVDGGLSAGRDAPLGNNSGAEGTADITISFIAVNTVTQNRQIRAVNLGRVSDVPGVSLDHERVGGELEFVFGTPFDYTLDLEIVGGATTSSTGRVTLPGFPAATSFVGDFGSTITWAGVSNVRDAVGNPVADFTAFSGTGADFRQAIVAPAPVPVPGVLPLFASALVMLRAARRTAHERR